jgi:site-specific DNA recombinase
MKAVAYVRVSTDEQSLSIEAQTEQIRLWCETHDLELIDTFVDQGISGAAPISERPGLSRAINRAIESQAQLVVMRRDRLARDRIQAAFIENRLRGKGCAILSADRDPGDPDDPEVRVLEGISDVVAEYERALVVRRTTRALALKRSRGEPVGNPPYGYEWARKGVLRICKTEQSTIRLAQKLRRGGLSCREVASQLDERGIKPRSGRQWNPDVVRKIAGERND